MEDEASSTNALNVRVLKFHYPQVQSIVDVASHVAVYQFDVQLQKWLKSSVEGTFFLVKDQDNRLGYIILNRNSLENLFLYIQQGSDVHLVDNYLIHKVYNHQVIGLWMFDSSELARIFKTVTVQV